VKFNINKILSEWAYRVDDGQPDVTNTDHVNQLREVLYNFGLPYKFIVEYVSNLQELEFRSKKGYDRYSSKHKIRPTTKVTVGGKETTAGELDDKDKESSDDVTQVTKHGAKQPGLGTGRKNLKGPTSSEKSLTGNVEFEKKLLKTINSLTDDNDMDLCKISVPGTNLFCADNKQIPRKQMPQLKAVPDSGSEAERLAKAGELDIDPRTGEVNTEPIFKKMLEDEGIPMGEPAPRKVATLKATQNQLVGSKVNMLNKVLSGEQPFEGKTLSPEELKKFQDSLREPIIISNDGYILDGHHRWAALVQHDIANGGTGDVEIDVKEVDLDAEALVNKANEFAGEMGLPVHAAGSLDEPETQPKPKTESQKELVDKIFKTEKVKGIKGGTSSGLLNEAVSVNTGIVNEAESKLDSNGIIDKNKSAADNLNSLNENYDKSIDIIVESLENDPDFLDSPLYKKTVGKQKMSKRIESMRKIAGSVAGNKKMILEAEAKHGWNSNKTDTERFIGSDNDLERAANKVNDFVKKTGKNGYLLTPTGKKIPFYNKDGSPNIIEYENKEGELVKGTIEEVVKHQILHSGGGKNAGDTISLSTNEGDPNGIIFHNVSNKTSTGDQIAHSTPKQDREKKTSVIDKLTKDNELTKDQAAAATEIIKEAETKKLESDKQLHRVSEKPAQTLKDEMANDKAFKKQVEHSFNNDKVPNKELSNDPNWPDANNPDHWRGPKRGEGINKDRQQAIIDKHGGLDGFIDYMQNQDDSQPNAEERKIMQRLCSRFKHKEGLDVEKKIGALRQEWINADEEEHKKLNKTKLDHKIEYKDKDGNDKEIKIELGMGDKLQAEEIMGMCHFHFADDDFKDVILKDTSITNNGGTNVTGKMLKDCLGVNNKTQFLGGLKRGETRVQQDSSKNATGLVIQEYALVIQINDNPPPDVIEKRVPIVEKRYRPVAGKTATIDSVGKWAPEMQACFESKRNK
jgi:hypothetical protein